MSSPLSVALIPAFCDALQYAHDEGVVHRDIKSEAAAKGVTMAAPGMDGSFS